MAAFSGKNGTVKKGATTLAELTSWSFSTEINSDAYASNSTGGYKKRVAGTRDGSGSIEFKVDSASGLPVKEGEEVTLELHVDDSGANYFSVPALITSVEIEVDMDDGSAVSGSADFEANGAWSGNGILA